MGSTEYRKALDAAVAELEAMLVEQARIEDRVLSLRKTVNALSTLCQEAGESLDWREKASPRLQGLLETSITQDVLSVINSEYFPVTTKDILNELEKLGTLDEHKNPLATISAILNRLEEQGKVTPTTKEGKRAWKRRLALSYADATGQSINKPK